MVCGLFVVLVWSDMFAITLMSYAARSVICCTNVRLSVAGALSPREDMLENYLGGIERERIQLAPAQTGKKTFGEEARKG